MKSWDKTAIFHVVVVAQMFCETKDQVQTVHVTNNFYEFTGLMGEIRIRLT